MKKSINILLAIFLMCGFVLIGCNKSENTEDTFKSEDSFVETTDKLVEATDYSIYPFTNISWTRDTEHDIETIKFGGNGKFTYYCACGNPVNDSDLCEGYTYDDNTKTITLQCIEITDEMVTIIKVVKCDENELHLDFNGELRIFNK